MPIFGNSGVGGEDIIVGLPAKKKISFKIAALILAGGIVVAGVSVFIIMVNENAARDRDKLRVALDSYEELINGGEGTSATGNITVMIPAIQEKLLSEYDERQEYYEKVLGAFSKVRVGAKKVFSSDSEQVALVDRYGDVLDILAGASRVHIDIMNGSDDYELLRLYIEGGVSGATTAVSIEVGKYVTNDSDLADMMLEYNQYTIELFEYFDSANCMDRQEVLSNVLDVGCASEFIDGVMHVIAEMDVIRENVQKKLASSAKELLDLGQLRSMI